MILLDTHIVVWLNLSTKRLSRPAAAAIKRARTGSGIAISAISLLELARLISANRVDRRGTVRETIESLIEGMLVKPITVEVAALTAYLPADFPSDPADRAIAATAQAEGIPLVTADEHIQAFPLVKTIW